MITSAQGTAKREFRTRCTGGAHDQFSIPREARPGPLKERCTYIDRHQSHSDSPIATRPGHALHSRPHRKLSRIDPETNPSATVSTLRITQWMPSSTDRLQHRTPTRLRSTVEDTCRRRASRPLSRTTEARLLLLAKVLA